MVRAQHWGDVVAALTTSAAHMGPDTAARPAGAGQPAPGALSAPTTHAEQLRERLISGTWTAAVHGLGYVGLPVAMAIADRGIRVIGLDIAESTVAQLSRGESHIEDVADELLGSHLSDGLASFTTNSADTTAADVVIITVPTPAGPDSEPDVSYVRSAAANAAAAARPGQLISLESTVYPGTSREIVAAAFAERGFVSGENVFIVYSPERINPGDRTFDLTAIPKLVGGLDATSTELGTLAYRNFVGEVHPVASAEVAELTKLLENVFRALNIGLANEMAMLCHQLGIDVWDVVAAASSKPFGYLPHYPGPGVGGHCIPVDPVYLIHRARVVGSAHTSLIEAATKINEGMPSYVVDRLEAGLRVRGRELAGSSLIVLGSAYKSGTADIRESPSVEVIALLRERGADVRYHDPLVPQLPALGLESVALSDATLAAADAIVLATDQPEINLAMVFFSARYVLDTRNAFRRRGLAGNNVEPL